MISRRRFLAMAAAAPLATRTLRARAQRAPAVSGDLEVRDLAVEGGAGSRRFTLCVPTHLSSGEKVPLVVLLHGLAETADERLGAYAWIERYGLVTAYERLRRPPVQRTSTRVDFTDERLGAVNSELAVRPFRGLVIACPFMPDIEIARPGALDGYANWIADVIVPRARREAPTIETTASTTLGGCSLGGHFSLETFLRRPETFGGWSGVQTAIGVGAADLYAGRIARALEANGPRDLFVETSTQDPFHAANEALARSLARRGIARELRVLPGPHDQPWLREAGTVELLLWHDERPRVESRIQRPLR